MTCYFVKIIFVHLLIISAICYFRFYQLIGWEHFLVSGQCSKSKDEKLLHLRSFKIARDIFNKYIFQMFDWRFKFLLSFMKGVQFFQPSQNENFVN